MMLHEFLLKNRDNYIDSLQDEKPVVRYIKDDKVISAYYDDFLDRILTRAKVFQTIEKRRVAIVAGNSYEWLLTMFSALLAGKDFIMVDANLNDQDMVGLLTYSDSEILITSEEFKEEFDFIPDSITMYSFADLKSMEDGKTYEDLSDYATFMVFTSGTSKSSKGVVTKIETMVKEANMIYDCFPGKNGDSIFLPPPFHHIYAFASIYCCLRQGSCLCIGSSPRNFEKELTVYDPEFAFLVPSMLRYMLDENLLVPSLYGVVTAGSPCPDDILSRVLDKGIEYHNFYGLSETLGPNCDVACREDGKLLKPYKGIRFFLTEDGELAMELPYHMEYYYKKPEETEQVLTGNIFLTGDQATIDENGNVRILGRLRDTIVLENGEKIHAADKDDELMELPHVKEAAVFSGEGGICAVIVPDDVENWKMICKSIAKLNRKYASFYRIQKYWMRTEKLPRTTIGKLKRFLIEKEYGNMN